MKLTISAQDKDLVLSIDVSPDMTLADLKAYVEAESDIEPRNQVLILNGKALDNDSAELSSWQISDGDMLLLLDKDVSAAAAAASGSASASSSSGSRLAGGGSGVSAGIGAGAGAGMGAGVGGGDTAKLHADIERVRQQMTRDNVLRQGVQQKYPELIEVLQDPVQFRERMITVERRRIEEESARQEELKRLQDDPYNEDAQKRILELIRQEAVMENLNSAVEHNPEVFGRVTMLFVRVWVNGEEVKAFVDSGAQATIMSPECVEKCHMSHLIDRRFQGIAKGVGEAEIIGRIHSAPMKLGDSFLPCSFTVLEGKGVDMLLGLDMLKRHQGVIDLKRNVLVMGDSEVSFLPESEIPLNFQVEMEGREAAEPRPGSAASTAATGSARIADAQPPPQSGPKSGQYPDDVVSNLMGLGFSQQQVVGALDQAGGNPELAAALLFQ